MKPEEQLVQWVLGNNVHNHERDECCPDFSCCQTRYKASDDERRLFRDRPELRDKMLMGFLVAAFSTNSDKVVYVAGSEQGHA